MNLEPYPHYKSSPDAWLGEIPDSWSSSPLKYVVTYNDDALGEDTDPSTAIEYVEISDVSETLGISGSTAVEFGAAPSRARRVVREGDVLVSTVRTYLRAVAQVPAAFDGAIASTGFGVLRAQRILPNFLGYAALSESFISQVIARSVGVSYPAINASELVRAVVPRPALEEQRLIADYLDTHTAKIDVLIEKQERLIEMLAERRKAVISQAVTKGLDPNAPMKNSGVEWLGSVPEGWAVGGLKRYGQLSTGSTPSTEVRENFDADEGRPWIRPQDLDPTVRGADGSLFLSPLGQGAVATVQPGSVLVVSTAWSISKIGYTNVECATNQQITAIQAPGCGEYLYLLLQAAKDEILASMVINRLPIIGNARLGSLQLPIPPLDEQRTIAETLGRSTSHIDRLSMKAWEMIGILKERRQALISAAVTGKIDVRGLS